MRGEATRIASKIDWVAGLLENSRNNHAYFVSHATELEEKFSGLFVAVYPTGNLRETDRYGIIVSSEYELILKGLERQGSCYLNAEIKFIEPHSSTSKEKF